MLSPDSFMQMVMRSHQQLPFLRRINQIGNLDSLHVVGTFANTTGKAVFMIQAHGLRLFMLNSQIEISIGTWFGMVMKIQCSLQGQWPSFTLIPAA
ncbi:MAG: hypothetical protein U5K69_22520 [Balneolaceae bacterium]|nr:hypothetical protein [Balneolaceae bacterium]